MAIVANNNSNQLLIASSPDGTSWSGFPQVPGSSKAAPALAVFNGQLFMAIVANNSSNNVLVASSPDGASWSGFNLVNQNSRTAPALAAFNGRLWLAVIHDDQQGFPKVPISSSTDGIAWAPFFLIPGVDTAAAPSLTVFNGRLWLAVRDDSLAPGNPTVKIAFTTNGPNWTPFTIASSILADDGPGFGELNGTLCLSTITLAPHNTPPNALSIG